MALTVPSSSSVAVPEATSTVALNLRYTLANIFVLLALFCALSFTRPERDLPWLFLASTGGVVAVLLAGKARWQAAVRSYPVATAFAAIALLALGTHHTLFAQSAELSYPAVWILGAAPGWFLLSLLWRSEPLPYWGTFGGGVLCLHELLLLGGMLLLAVLAGSSFLFEGIRPEHPLSDAAALGALMYLALIPLVHVLLLRPAAARRSGVRSLIALGLVGYLLALLLFATASRAAIGLFGLAVLFWAGLAVANRMDRRRFTLLLVFACLGAASAYGLSDPLQSTLEVKVAEDPATAQRMLLNQAALELIEEFPWAGTGLLSFGARYAAIRDPADASSGGTFVHNDYLQLWVEGGLLLLALLLLVAVLIALRILRTLGRTVDAQGDSDTYPLLQSLGGWLALSLLFAHMLVNFLLYTLPICLLVGSIAAWALSRGGANRSIRLRLQSSSSRGHWLSWIALCLYVSLGLFWLGADAYAASVFSGQKALPGTDYLRATPARQQRFARLLTQVNETRGTPQLVQALQAQAALGPGATALRRNAVDRRFEAAGAADPLNPSIALLRAAYLSQQKNGDGESVRRARSLVMGVLDRDPRNLTALKQYLELTDDAADRLAAADRYFLPWLSYHRRTSPEGTMYFIQWFARDAASVSDADRVIELQNALAATSSEPAMAAPVPWYLRWLD